MHYEAVIEDLEAFQRPRTIRVELALRMRPGRARRFTATRRSS
jgi:hypothetical protein